jgi:putative FmdB family regulatory protein
MPLYEYECETCGHRFEVIQKFSDPPLEACGACGGPLKKLLSSPAIQFKGSGWYITDYARKSGEKSASPGGPSSDSSKPSSSPAAGESSSSTRSTTPAGTTSKES